MLCAQPYILLCIIEGPIYSIHLGLSFRERTASRRFETKDKNYRDIGVFPVYFASVYGGGPYDDDPSFQDFSRALISTVPGAVDVVNYMFLKHDRS